MRDLIAHDFIFSGAVPPGSLLPSEKLLCDQYGVSRVTLRASMNRLQEGGLIKSRHGIGWIVLTSSTLMQRLDHLSSLDTLAREAGQEVTTEDLEWTESVASEVLAHRLHVAVGSPVTAIQRVKVFNGTRVAWLLDYVPVSVLPLATLAGEFNGSILDILLAHRELEVEYADTEIEPILLSRDIARRLGVSPGRPALYLEAVAMTVAARPVECAKAWLLPEHFRFRLRRRRQLTPPSTQGG